MGVAEYTRIIHICSTDLAHTHEGNPGIQQLLFRHLYRQANTKTPMKTLLHNWLIPVIAFPASIAVLLVSLYYETRLLINVSSLLFLISFVLLLISVIYQFIQLRWKEGIISFAVFFLLASLFLYEAPYLYETPLLNRTLPDTVFNP